MPKLVGLNEKYKDKGLVIVFVGYESKAKLDAYAKQYNITWPIALEPTKNAQKVYGVRGYPTSFLIAPNGKVAWKGHPAEKKLEDMIKELLKKVKIDKGGKSADLGEDPVKLKLREDVSEKLKFAVKQAARGELASALRMADRALSEEGSSEEEKKDAKYVKDEVEKHAAKLLAEADRLLKEKMPYEAKQLLYDTRKAFAGSDYATKAQEKLDSISSDEKLADELKAGEIYAKAAKCKADGKEEDAKKYFEQIVDKYPDTEYAKRAKDKLK